MQEDQRGSAATPVVHLAGYEGPIDLLLDLARAQRVDIGQLAIGALVDQYLAAVEAPAAATLAERGDWLIAASWLVLLKSKLLGQAEIEAAVPEADQLRAGLVRAEQRQHARALADWLEKRPQLGRDVFARGAPEEMVRIDPAAEGDLLDLLLACFDLLAVRAPATHEAAQAYTPPVLDVWPLADALLHLRTWLRDHPGGGELADLMPRPMGSTSTSPLRRRSRLASGFLAGLELAKQGEVLLWQDQTFGPLQVEPPRRTP